MKQMIQWTVAMAGRLPLVKVSDIEKTEAWFLRHGPKAVFFGRMIPIFRSLISVPAGVERMPVALFLAYTALGSLIWNVAFVLAGYGLGENWHRVEEYAGLYSKGVLAAVALVLAGLAAHRVVTARRIRDRI